MESYLTDRSQSMRVSSNISEPMRISMGVPQGSILGPLLFNNMVNDMLDEHGDVLSYADDTILFATGDTQAGAMDCVISHFNRIQQWYSANGLSLCPEKTKCIIFSNRDICPVPVNLNGHSLEIQPHVKLLGIWLDSKLTFAHHISVITNTANSSICALRKIRSFLDRDQTKQIYTSIVRPKLEYCSGLFLNIARSLSIKLELSQNRAVRTICKAPSIFSVNDARPLIGLHTLSSRRNHTFSKRMKALYFSDRPNKALYNLLTKTSFSHNLSLRTKCNLSLPAVNSHFGTQRFTYQGIKALKSAEPPLQFKTNC